MPTKEQYWKNPEKWREETREYFNQHKQEHQEYNREYREEHKDEVQEHKRKYCQEHKKEEYERNKQWRKNNPDKFGLQAARYNNKHHRNLSFVPLNKSFKNSDAHHLDRTYVIYIPKEIHRSIRHSVLRNINMAEINAIAFNYLRR